MLSWYKQLFVSNSNDLLNGADLFSIVYEMYVKIIIEMGTSSDQANTMPDVTEWVIMKGAINKLHTHLCQTISIGIRFEL